MSTSREYGVQLRRKLDANRGRPLWELAVKSGHFVARSARSRVALRRATSIGVGVRILGLAPLIQNHGTLRLGNDVTLEAPLRRIMFNVWPGACLVIADEVAINDGARLDCTSAIHIGKRARIGFGAVVLDNHFHGTHDRLTRPAGEPVVLGDDVWIAANAMILPGVTVGAGAIVAAGAVVRRDVAPFTIVAGNPAQAVGALDPARFAPPAPSDDRAHR